MHCATWSANPNTFFLFPIVPYHKITKRRNLDDNTKTTPPAATTKYTSFRSFDFHLIQLIATPISITSTFRMSRAIIRAKISFDTYRRMCSICTREPSSSKICPWTKVFIYTEIPVWSLEVMWNTRVKGGDMVKIST